MTLNKFKKIIKERGGQSLGEVLVGLTIGAILIGAASFLVVNSLRSNASLEKSQKATQIAQELLDKVRSWGSADWFNIYNLSKGSDNKYFLNASSTELVPVSGEEGILSDDVTYGLIGYWKFDESTSTAAYDSSGNNNNGTLTNGPTRATSTCKVNDCLNFDGVDDYVVAGGIGFNISNEFTVGLWVKSTNFSPTMYQLEGLYGKPLLQTGSNKVTLTLRNQADTNWVNYTSPNSCLNNSQWNFILATYNTDDSVNLFCNGLNVYSGTHAGYIGGFSTGTTIQFGGRSTVFMNGQIDDVRIYNRALSADEIKRLYQSSVYTRSFYVENTCRSTGATGEITGSGDSCAGGSTNDPSTQKINISVGWETGVTSTQLSLTDYLTRWKNAIFEQADWSGGVDNSGSYQDYSDAYSSTTNTSVSSSVILDLP